MSVLDFLVNISASNKFTLYCIGVGERGFHGGRVKTGPVLGRMSSVALTDCVVEIFYLLATSNGNESGMVGLHRYQVIFIKGAIGLWSWF